MPVLVAQHLRSKVRGTKETVVCVRQPRVDQSDDDAPYAAALARLRVPAVYKTLMAIASSRASGLIPDARPRPWYVRVWMRA